MVQNLLIRNILRTYLPITILVSLISTVETFINTFLAAIWLSGEDVVPISVPSYLTWFISITGSMVATGSSILFSRYLAHGRSDNAINVYNVAMIVGIILGLIFFAICLIYSYLIQQGDTPLSSIISADYVSAMGISAIPLIVLQIAVMFLRMDNDRPLAVICFAVFIIIDIASVWIAIQERLGSFGVGISVAIGSVVALMLLPVHMRIKGRNMVIRPPTDLLKGMKSMYRIGFRSILQRVCMTLRYYFLNLFISTSGIVVVGCLTAQSVVLHLLVPIFIGCAIMSTVLSGTFYPLGDRRSLNDSIRELSKASLVITVLMMVLVLILSEDITDLLVSGEEKRQAALTCLRWFALSIPTTAICMILLYMYHSTKHKTLSNVLIVYRSIILMFIIVLALSPVIDENAIWISFLLSDLLMLATVVVIACIRNHRFPTSVDDLMMLRGEKYDVPPIYSGSIHNDKEELKGMLIDIEKALSDHSLSDEVISSALDGIKDVVGKTIDHAYKDPIAHQIDVLIRMDDGLNIVIKDDSSGEIDISEDIKQAKSLDLNIYYINIDSKQYSDRSVTAHNS